jgi:hypothetical protein
MKDNLYKTVVLEESERLFGDAVKISFPDDSPMGKVIVTRGRNQGVVAINLVDLCEQPEPPDYDRIDCCRPQMSLRLLPGQS